MRRTRALLLIGIIVGPLLSACGDGGPTSPGSGASFQGVWTGTWIRTGCSDTTGGAACNATPTSGALRLTLTQAGTEVQGSVEITSFVVSGTGTVDGGVLTLTGQAHQPALNLTATLSNWSTTRSGSTMSGGFTLMLMADNPAFGSQTLQLSLQNVTLTS